MSNNRFIYIGLGGNIGDTNHYFNEVCRIFEESGIQIVKKSSVYETEPWGFKAIQTFLNQVLAVDTALSPDEFLGLCQQIELKSGRQRGSEQYISRTIDIDILLWKDEVIDLPELKVPHPLIAKRRFVLDPLHEIAPDLKHPVNGMTIKDLLLQCEDKLKCQVKTTDF
jgi:2-amino-4-hydroxy-6-hydroxymethyldihydropteridine diphosphokinase